MTERRVYVYRLDVVYPEGSDAPYWEPEDWEGWPGGPSSDPEVDDSFRWPKVTRYLSYSTAKRKADLLAKFGAKVVIERSEPVTWGVSSQERAE